MSGHSKWSSIKHKKGAADAKRGQLFSKLSRAITVAAKEGGGDPTGNATLATAIQKAKDNSMPKDNIERAIAKGAGGGEGANYETIMYEGYGPAGVAVLVEAMTDNRNRTAADIRNIFSRTNGKLGETGTVAWIFERKGSIVVDAGATDEDTLMTVAIDAGAEDVTQDENIYEIVTDPSDFMAVREALEAAGIPFTSAELAMLPKNTVQLEMSDAKKMLRLMDALEESDDVQEVHANFDISEEILEALA
ncbi:MAG: YebC/PmpR family DNA-binding transcriptional regulator [Actinobacteria bacterium]|nr:YebC/PmpR family DNA-binding transcriptional regulator [Actinomycetota bacterium]MCL5883119.1 YebC/PmpR family DNA-binding transcriptional regulator [Actinomycetota bacterium]